MLRIWIALLVIAAEHQVRGNYLQNDTVSCSSLELPCDDGVQCINFKTWCDGFQDCFDRSDERFCLTGNPDDPATATLNGCPKHSHYTCDDGSCIPLAARCNDVPNCENREDEEGCDYYEPGGTEAALVDTLSTTATPPIDTTTKDHATTKTAPRLPPPVTIHNHSIPFLPEVLRKSIEYMIKTRDSSWGWGELTPRISTAISLANESYFDSHDGYMTKKELELQLALYLGKREVESLRHPEHRPKVMELAYTVNALIATHHNPTDFYHWNVVQKLKKSMAQRQSKGLFVHPLAYLALCNGNSFSDSYLPKIKNMAYRRSEEARWFDVQRYALLVISCAARSSTSKEEEWKALKMDVAKNITESQQSDGGFGTLHNTALALQALIAADEPATEVNIKRAMTWIVYKQDLKGSFGKTLDNYYVLPALNMKSLADLRNKNGKVDPDGTQNTEGERELTKKTRLNNVHLSLWIGGEKPEMPTITAKAPPRSNAWQVMEIAQKMNPLFKFEMLKTSRGDVLHSIAGRVSDTEKSTYWAVYRKVPLAFRPTQLANVTATMNRLKFLGAKKWTRNLSRLYPRNEEHLVFWYKPYN